MSRYSAHGIRYGIAYGIDRAPAVGPFVQVFDREDPDADPLVDLDRLGGVEVTADMILELSRRYRVEIETEALVQQRMSEDAPPFDQAPALCAACDAVLRQAQKNRGEA